jgi:hypothetical protein
VSPNIAKYDNVKHVGDKYKYPVTAVFQHMTHEFLAFIALAWPTIKCACPVIWIAWRVRRAAGFAGGEPDPETITTNTMMPIML